MWGGGGGGGAFGGWLAVQYSQHMLTSCTSVPVVTAYDCCVPNASELDQPTEVAVTCSKPIAPHMPTGGVLVGQHRSRLRSTMSLTALASIAVGSIVARSRSRSK